MFLILSGLHMDPCEAIKLGRNKKLEKGQKGQNMVKDVHLNRYFPL